eukprot:1993651-Pyramimonas_sp.AAC.1
MLGAWAAISVSRSEVEADWGLYCKKERLFIPLMAVQPLRNSRKREAIRREPRWEKNEPF